MTKKEFSGYPHIDRAWLKYYDQDILDAIDPKMNLTDYLKWKSKDYSKQVATTYYKNQIRYQEFWNMVDKASQVLSGVGVRKNDRIMCLVPNIPEAGQLWLGATQIGAVTDFVDPRPDSMDFFANAKKVLELLKYEKANYIIALDKCYSAMLKPIEEEIKEMGISKIILVSASDSMGVIGMLDYIKDAIRYNELHNLKVTDQQIEKLKAYQIVLEKTKSMVNEQRELTKAIKESPLEVLKYSSLLHDYKNIPFTKVYEENMVNYIGHTSGTSGARPKPICLTNENHISSTEQLFRAKANFQVGDRILHELPFFSPLGADNNFVLNLASGSNNIDIPEFDISEFGYLLEKYYPNVILGTPSWLSALPSCPYLSNLDFSCIKRIIYGGDSMTREDEERLNLWLKEHGSSAEVEKGHGMSEYCGCGSYAQGEYNRYDSIGIPLPNTIYTIVDPNIEDRLVPLKFESGQKFLKGELVVSSDAVTNGVLDGKVIVPHFKMDGNDYIRTRDLVMMDRDGVFYFEARKDRSFTRFDGYKVKPREIEKVIEDHEQVKYCRIVPYFDSAKNGLMPIAHVVLKEDSSSYESLTQITKDIIWSQMIHNPDMSSRQIPSKFKFRTSLPLTANSKINYNALTSEGVTGDEISVDVEETNLSVGNIAIYSKNSNKVKKIQLKK